MDETLEEMIIRWATDSDMFRGKVEDDKARFNLYVEYPEGSGNVMDIVGPVGRDDTVLIIARVTIDPSHRTAFAALPAARKTELINEIMRVLIFQPVGFMASPSIDNPEGFQFVKDMYEDGMTKTSFMEGLGWVHRCITYVVWRYNNTFSEGKGAEVPCTMYC
ncbi:MAG: DUF2299 family protein [Methanomassiliicoccales archaeon]|jgi:hypothetical protein